MFRILPTSVYHTSAVETWLEDLSKKGVHFRCFWGAYAIGAEKGEPSGEIYRLEAGDGRPAPEAERLEAYEAAGWEYAGAASDNALWLFRATRPDPVPLHTDPETQYLAFRRLRWRPWLYLALWLAVAALYIFLTAERAWGPYGLRAQDLQLLFLRMFLPVFWGGLCLEDILALKKLLKPLRAGVPLDHHAPCRQTRRWWYWGVLIAYTAYSLLVLFVL